MDNVLFWMILLVISYAAACALLFNMTLKNFESLNNKIIFTIIYTIILSPFGAYLFSVIYKYRKNRSSLMTK